MTGHPNDIPTTVDDQDAEDLLRELIESRESDLEPITPNKALELYLDDKSREYQEATVRSHRSRLGFFVDWCAEQCIDNLNDVSARDVHEFRVWRRDDLNVVSEKSQMDTVRVFLEWCETIDAVRQGLYKKIDSPAIPDGGKARETSLEAERADRILDYLATYEYASVEHVTWLVLVETGVRMGAAHALDVGDYQVEDETRYLGLRHRPDEDTPLKNGRTGERPVSITEEAGAVIDDYLENRRHDVTDGFGREPLLATSQGRLSKSTIRSYVYKWSRPCAVGAECPHDRVVEECDAAAEPESASRCPSSRTPHPIRRGYITELLKQGVPVDVVGERCNVSPAVIDEHYDVRSEDEKMRQREQVIRDALE